MRFAAGVTVQRLRRQRSTDRVNPARQSLGTWASATSVTIPGAYISSTSTSSITDANRSEVTIAKSLFCAPSADVKVGDRIASGEHTYDVREVPEADINPFTGWQPLQEIPLTEVFG